MKKNVGTTDSWIRIILGLAIAILGVVFESWWGLLGVALLATGVFHRCLIYLIFKISTKKKEE